MQAPPRRFRPCLIALAIVTLWGAYSVAYIGVEDGSSGLSPAGYVHAAFLLPGVWVLQEFRGALGNRDLPVAAAISWLGFAVPALCIAYVCARRSARR